MQGTLKPTRKNATQTATRGYPRAVVAKRKKHKATEPTAINLRVPGFLVSELDAWVDDLNKDGRYPPLSRVDLIRAVLLRAAKERWGAP